MKRIYGCVLGTFLILLFFQTVGCSGPSIEFSEEPVEAEGTIKLVLLRKGFTEFSMEFFLVAEPNVYNLNINQTCETHTGSDAAITTGSGFLIGSCGKYFLLHSDATYKVKGIPEKEGVVLSTRP
ncbi:MAG: hypothetical protein KC618_08715, partial [Candidatus Omnitrophica bacterium]|nr:hypothetical protein [Candidatus Omnitrophota bacterium]